MDESIRTIEVEAGHPLRLGMHETGGTFHFSIFSRHATGVSLLLFDQDDCEPARVVELSPEQHRTGGVWHIGLKGQLHGKGYAIWVQGHQIRTSRATLALANSFSIPTWPRS
jgi:isoamylase